MRWRRLGPRRVAALSIAGCLLTTAMLGMELAKTLTGPASARVTGDRPAPQPQADDRAQHAQSPSAMEIILDRPLFSPARRPLQPPPPPVAAVIPPALPQSRLIGFARRAGEPVAVVQTPDGATLFARPGDEVEPEWILQAIGETDVTLTGPAGEVVLPAARPTNPGVRY
jgi:hypothetical protein